MDESESRFSKMTEELSDLLSMGERVVPAWHGARHAYACKLAVESHARTTDVFFLDCLMLHLCKHHPTSQPEGGTKKNKQNLLFD